LPQGTPIGEKRRDARIRKKAGHRFSDFYLIVLAFFDVLAVTFLVSVSRESVRT